MLRIVVPGGEQWDEGKGEFLYGKGAVLQLEHSLVSLSKWEAKWRKPFLDEKKEKTPEEMLDYIRCMSLVKDVPEEIYSFLTPENFREINEYIQAPMTATWFSDRKGSGGHGSRGKTLTAEVIYYDMIALGIPFECQKWHLNRLLTLIKVCEEESRPKKKMGRKELMRSNAALNAARRKRLNSRG